MIPFNNFLDAPPTGFDKDHSVVIYFMYNKDELDELHALDRKLEKIIREAGVGKYDYHEINLEMTDGTLYMYGPNAEELFKTVRPTLQETDFTKRGCAVLTFGPSGTSAKKIEVQITD